MHVDDSSDTAEAAAKVGNQAILYQSLHLLSSKTTPTTTGIRVADDPEFSIPEELNR